MAIPRELECQFGAQPLEPASPEGHPGGTKGLEMFDWMAPDT
jgi:hypothetical protein